MQPRSYLDADLISDVRKPENDIGEECSKPKPRKAEISKRLAEILPRLKFLKDAEKSSAKLLCDEVASIKSKGHPSFKDDFKDKYLATKLEEICISAGRTGEEKGACVKAAKSPRSKEELLNILRKYVDEGIQPSDAEFVPLAPEPLETDAEIQALEKLGKNNEQPTAFDDSLAASAGVSDGSSFSEVPFVPVADVNVDEPKRETIDLMARDGSIKTLRYSKKNISEVAHEASSLIKSGLYKFQDSSEESIKILLPGLQSVERQHIKDKLDLFLQLVKAHKANDMTWKHSEIRQLVLEEREELLKALGKQAEMEVILSKRESPEHRDEELAQLLIRSVQPEREIVQGTLFKYFSQFNKDGTAADGQHVSDWYHSPDNELRSGYEEQVKRLAPGVSVTYGYYSTFNESFWVYKVKPDGNCLFSVMAGHLNGIRYSGKTNWDACSIRNEIRDFAESKVELTDEILQQQLHLTKMKYMENLKKGCSQQEIGEELYGTTFDIILFSMRFKINVKCLIPRSKQEQIFYYDTTFDELKGEYGLTYQYSVARAIPPNVIQPMYMIQTTDSNHFDLLMKKMDVPDSISRKEYQVEYVALDPVHSYIPFPSIDEAYIKRKIEFLRSEYYKAVRYEQIRRRVPNPLPLDDDVKEIDFAAQDMEQARLENEARQAEVAQLAAALQASMDRPYEHSIKIKERGPAPTRGSFPDGIFRQGRNEDDAIQLILKCLSV
jgi:hypothetical protein